MNINGRIMNSGLMALRKAERRTASEGGPYKRRAKMET